jgi:hypothetical protein
MMQRVYELLKGNYWVIDISKMKLLELELNFLENFFTIEREVYFDEKQDFQEKVYLILKKKPKFLSIIH